MYRHIYTKYCLRILTRLNFVSNFLHFFDKGEDIFKRLLPCKCGENVVHNQISLVISSCCELFNSITVLCSSFGVFTSLTGSCIIYVVKLQGPKTYHISFLLPPAQCDPGASEACVGGCSFNEFTIPCWEGSICDQCVALNFNVCPVPSNTDSWTPGAHVITN